MENSLMSYPYLRSQHALGAIVLHLALLLRLDAVLRLVAATARTRRTARGRTGGWVSKDTVEVWLGRTLIPRNKDLSSSRSPSAYVDSRKPQPLPH